MTRPENDNSYYSYNFLMDDIAMSMGGRIAEELVFKDITSGASADINQATKIAHAMVYDYGMSKRLGFISLGSDQQVFIGRDYQQKRDFSEKLASEADDEIREILDYNYKRARKLLQDNLPLLENMAKLLLDRETINKDEIDMLMAGKKAEEIAKIMEEREAEQRKKEKILREEMEKKQKLESYERKVLEGKKLLAGGIISEEEYNAIVKSYKELVSQMEKEKPVQKEDDAKDDAKKEEGKKEEEKKEVKNTNSSALKAQKPLSEKDKKADKTDDKKGE